MGHVLLTCHLPTGADASVESAASSLGVPRDAIDPEFGVVLIDPDQRAYAVMVDERHVDAAAADARSDAPSEYGGPFANPRIETFGDPDPADERDA